MRIYEIYEFHIFFVTNFIKETTCHTKIFDEILDFISNTVKEPFVSSTISLQNAWIPKPTLPETNIAPKNDGFPIEISFSRGLFSGANC